MSENLLGRISKELKIPNKDKVKLIYKSVCKAVADHLKEGNSVTLPGVGRLSNNIGSTLKDEIRINIKFDVDKDLSNMVESTLEKELDDYDSYSF